MRYRSAIFIFEPILPGLNRILRYREFIASAFSLEHLLEIEIISLSSMNFFN